MSYPATGIASTYKAWLKRGRELEQRRKESEG